MLITPCVPYHLFHHLSKIFIENHEEKIKSFVYQIIRRIAALV